MSKLVTLGEVTSAFGDAYGAYTGGMDSAANKGTFGAAAAGAIFGIAVAGHPAGKGLAMGLGAGSSAIQLGINVSALTNKDLTPAQRLGAGLGVLGAGAGLLAQITPPHFKTPCAKKPAKPSLSATTSPASACRGSCA